MQMELQNHYQVLNQHPLYTQIKTINDLKVFMETHVFAVWDFMSLLKKLQNDITTTSVPWTPSKYSGEMVRFMNEIVIAEESDESPFGVMSHFEMYLEAMKEVGANTTEIVDFIQTMSVSNLKPTVQEFVTFNLDIALNGTTVEAAAAFFYGREKIIPEMFTQIKKVLTENNLNCPKLMYYFERHIEVDGNEHGPKAEMVLNNLMNTSSEKRMAREAAQKSLQLREKLWDSVVESLNAPAPAKAKTGDVWEDYLDLSKTSH